MTNLASDELSSCETVSIFVFRIGGNTEDVEKVEKLLMEREKMAEEFFKEEKNRST